MVNEVSPKLLIPLRFPPAKLSGVADPTLIPFQMPRAKIRLEVFLLTANAWVAVPSTLIGELQILVVLTGYAPDSHLRVQGFNSMRMAGI
jgi:hypothetical protein